MKGTQGPTRRLRVLPVLLFLVVVATVPTANAAVPAVQGATQEWAARYHNARADGNPGDWGRAVAVDGARNVYVTGFTGAEKANGTFVSDYATVKYDGTGRKLWARIYKGPGGEHDWPYDIAVDGVGNVYVTGFSYGAGTEDDYATVKYNSAGQLQWVRRYDSPDHGYDVAYALAVDGSGNAYVTGASSGDGLYDTDYATVKYDAAGNQKWVRVYDGPAAGNEPDGAKAVTLDGSGNVYVTGASWGAGTGPDYATIKYDPTGNRKWVTRYDGPTDETVESNESDEAVDLAADGSGNVYVTGNSFALEPRTFEDLATVKYDTNGNQKWVRRFDAVGFGNDEAAAIDVDTVGNVYVAGTSYWGSETYEDYATIKYDAAGNQKWVQQYHGPTYAVAYDEAVDLEVGPDGNPVVTGYSDNPSGSYAYDYATVKYSSAGTEMWAARYNGPINGWDQSYDLAIDGS
jgi:hypothetical protein